MKEAKLPHIDAAHDAEANLDDKKRSILRKLFTDEECITVDLMSPGQGGASLFQITPIDAQGRSKAPFVVKIGDKREMLEEHRKFKYIVKPFLHQHRAAIEDEPVICCDVAGIKYTQISDIWPQNKIRDFEKYYKEVADPERICKTLTDLLGGILGRTWYSQSQSQIIRMQEIYNQLLPAQLTITANSSDISVGISSIDHEFSDLRSLIKEAGSANADIIGRKVALPNLKITEIDKRKMRVKDSQCYNTKIDILITPSEEIAKYEVGDTITLMHGEIIQTRRCFLEKQVEQSVIEPPGGEKVFSFNNEELLFNKGGRLPNPLHRCPKLLEQQSPIRLSIIHGDLNLGNILVDRNHNTWLIDYAKTEDNGHVAFDFAKLETEIKTHILAKELDLGQFLDLETELWKNTLEKFNRFPPLEFSSEQRKAFEVITAIRRTAERFLTPYSNEYFYSLFFYSLAALKFKNLCSKSKIFAFVSSAFPVALLLDCSPPREEVTRPEAPEDFVGREDVLHYLDESFKQCSVVVVYGVGGIGKTYVGDKYCSKINEPTQKKIVKYKASQEVGQEEVLTKLAKSLGRNISERVESSLRARSEEGAINLILRALDAGDYFLYFDDFHKIKRDDAIYLFSKLSKGLKVTHTLILSRSAPDFYRKDSYKELEGKFGSISLSGFNDTDFKEFVNYLKISNADYQKWKEKLQEISRRVSGHPYTIAQAAKLLEKRVEINVKKLPADLEEALDQLSKSIFGQLTEDDKMLLDFLSAFQRNFEREAIKYAPNIKGDLGTAFKNLRDWDIVKEPSPGVYRIHDTIKSILRDRSSKDKLYEMHERCGGYLSEEGRSLDDKMEAVFHFCESNNPKRALELIGDSRKEMERSGRIQELMDKLHVCLDKFRKKGDIEGELKVNFHLGELYSQQRKEEAEKLFKRNIQVRRSQPVSPEKALDYLELGRFYTRVYQGDRADEALTEGLRLAKQTNDVICQTKGYYYLGRLHRNKATGLEYLKKAESMLPDDERNGKLAGEIYNTLGEAYSIANRPRKGLEYYSRAIEIFRESENWYQLGGAYRGRGSLYHRLWDFDSAIKDYELNVDLIEEKLLDPHLLNLNLNLLAEVCRLKGDREQAHTLLKKSLSVAEQIEDKRRIADISNTKLCFANLLMDEGKVKEAERYCLEAGDLLGGSRPRPWMERIFLRLYRLEEDWQKAETAIKEVHVVSEDEEAYELAMDFLEIGLLYRDINEKAQAQKWFDKAFEKAQEAQNRLLAKRIKELKQEVT